ncbi:MAG: hypothetical protein ACRDO4_07005 [Nocardioides sp.]
MWVLRQAVRRTVLHVRQRHARWQVDATYRSQLRQQRRLERRRRLLWDLRRRWEQRRRLRELWEQRPRWGLREQWEQRPRWNLREQWEQRPRWNLRQRWEQRSRREPRRRWVRIDGRAVRQVAVVTTILLVGGGAGYATIWTAGDGGFGKPSAEGATGSAADRSPRGESPRRMPGVFLSVAVTDGGKLEVAESARTSKPLDELSLLPPPAPDGVRGLPRLEDVQLSADGEPVKVPTTIEVTTVVVLDRPATLIELRYRVVGATARSKPATPGRATLSLRPALAPTLHNVRAVVAVRGTKVHNLVCVDLRSRAQLCGIKHRDGWRTRRLPIASAAVVALVDLPRRAA